MRRFQSKRHRDDPSFIRWETQPVGPLELAPLAEIIAARHHPKYVFTYVARGKKGGKGGTGQNHMKPGKHDPITVEALTTRWQTAPWRRSTPSRRGSCARQPRLGAEGIRPRQHQHDDVPLRSMC
jgi:hypothetical protein